MVFLALCDFFSWNFCNFLLNFLFTIFGFLIFLAKDPWTCLPSLEGDLFVTFDTVELMSFLNDCGKYLFQTFRLSAFFFRNFLLFKGNPHCFRSWLPLEQSRFASWNCFRDYETFSKNWRKLTLKNCFFLCFQLGKRWFPSFMHIPWSVFLHWEIRKRAKIVSFA